VSNRLILGNPVSVTWRVAGKSAELASAARTALELTPSRGGTLHVANRRQRLSVDFEVDGAIVCPPL
jgi:hypothetical protein